MEKSNHNSRYKVIFLMGPTASGKTNLAIELKKRHPVHLISVDSTMVYRELNIGTGKPSLSCLQAYPHALVNECNLSEVFTAADFCRRAHEEIIKAYQLRLVPVLVGGTMMYFHALQHGLSPLPSSSLASRAYVDHQIQNKGLQYLHQTMAEKDPRAAQRIHNNDLQRVSRWHEVFYLTGQSMSTLLANSEILKNEYEIVPFALYPKDRKILHHSIAKRFESMLADGLVAELKDLMSSSELCLQHPGLRSVGYRQVVTYLNNEIDYEQMKSDAMTATRQLCKRQFTWLRKWNNLIWLDSEKKDMEGFSKLFQECDRVFI